MRIGVFGGTFDPPHVGHVIVAEDVRTYLELDRVLLIPARVSPFKMDEAGITDPEVRLRMVDAAVEHNPGLTADRIELDRDPPSWTVDTLEALRRRSPEAELFLLVGADQWSAFGRWRGVERIAELATIVVLAREGAEPDALDPGVEVSWRSAPVRRIDISSTEIRDRVRRGDPIAGFVPDAVAALIDEHALYRSAPAAQTA
ncbi:MAG: nicotinate-nucleotide adenylyltransferase [Longimicrobiales bacterium]|nr:nicotinate-nucleotide adenylyltransferase [Longimicrobiales bacterium]